MSNAVLLGGGAVGSGLAIAVAAVEANPEVALAMTPDLGASIVGLVCAGVVFALKNYVPSEKDVKHEFALVKTQHAELMADSRAVKEELKEHRIELAKWMGDVNRNLSNINGKIDSLEHTRKAS